jgi:hypothetical protein
LRTDLASGPLGTAQLLIGGVVANGVGLTPAPGEFATFTATYVSTAADIGQTITIQLSSTAGQGDFDNVSVDATLVPEPASLALFGLGLLGLSLLGRRKAA